MSSPPSTMRPAVGSSSFSTVLPTVDLPQPTRRPGPASRRAAIAKLTPSTACTAPTRRCSRPPWIGKCFTRSVDLEDSGASAHAAAAARARPPSRRRVWPAPASIERRRLGAAAVGREARSAARRRSRRSAASATARCRGSPAAAAACPPPRPRRRAAGSRASGRACRDAAGCANSASTGASSTLRPAYITTTRCAVSATTPRSCVISMIAVPSLLLELQHQVEDLRLDGDVERGGRLVGDQHLRIAGQRHGDHHALAHAARELVRIFVERGAADRRCAPGRASRCARSRAARHRQPMMAHDVLGDLRADGQHRIEAGHRLLEDHRDAMAAHRAHLALPAASSARVPSNWIEPPTMRPVSGGISRRIDSAVTDLPQPDSPTMPSVSPRAEVERHAVDRAHHAVAREELRLQVADREDGVHARLAHSASSPSRGSSRSRRPSPSRLTASTVMARKRAGDQDDPWRDLEEGAALGDDVAPARDLRRHAGAEEATGRPRSASPRRRHRSPARSAAPACWAGCGAPAAWRCACRRRSALSM